MTPCRDAGTGARNSSLSLHCMSLPPFNKLILAGDTVCPSKIGLLFWAALRLSPGQVAVS